MAKKLPERKCLGCMVSFPKSSLIRVVRSPEGEITLDTTGKKSGRGAYICKRAECLKKAVKRKRAEFMNLGPISGISWCSIRALKAPEYRGCQSECGNLSYFQGSDLVPKI